MKTFALIVLLSFNAHADGLYGRWIQRKCYLRAGGGSTRNELFVLPDRSFLKKISFSTGVCRDEVQTSEIDLKLDPSAKEVQLDGLNYSMSTNGGYLIGTFDSYYLAQTFQTDGSVPYARQCPNFSGHYQSKTATDLFIEQNGCLEIRMDPPANGMNREHPPSDVFIPNGLTWSAPIADDHNDDFQSYADHFEADVLVRNATDYYGKIKDTYYFSKTACGAPHDGRTYLIVQRKDFSTEYGDYCNVYEKVF